MLRYWVAVAAVALAMPAAGEARGKPTCFYGKTPVYNMHFVTCPMAKRIMTAYFNGQLADGICQGTRGGGHCRKDDYFSGCEQTGYDFAWGGYAPPRHRSYRPGC